MNPVEHARHLARRLFGMLSRAPVSDDDRVWAAAWLSLPETELWGRLSVADQRHSLQVARRFVRLLPDADRSSVAAALLHDIGKLDSHLGVWMRVVATLAGPRTDRFRRYHDHEQIGARMLRDIGADERTVALVEGTSTDPAIAAALQSADDI